jgi:MFS family permease
MGNLKNLFYSSLFSGIVAGALGVILPLYLSEGFGTSLTSMGFVFSAYALLFAVIQIPSSYLGDRFNKRKILLASSLLDAVSILAYGLAGRVSHFVFGKGVEGVASSINRAPSDALLIELSERHRYSESFGNLIGYFSVGYVCGYLIAGPLVNLFGYRKAILSLLFFQAISLGFLWFVRHKETPKQIAFNLHKFFHKPHRNLKILAFTGMLVTFVENMDYTVTIIFLKDVYGASISQIGLVMGLAWLFYGVTQILVGRHADALGRKRVYLLGGAVAGISALILPNMHSIIPMTAFFILLSIGHGMALPAIRGIAAHSTSEKYRSQDFGYISAFEEAGAIFGFPIMGYIADNLGYNAAFYLRGITILSASCVVMLLIREHKKPLAE